jgi:hypothetical protein
VGDLPVIFLARKTAAAAMVDGEKRSIVYSGMLSSVRYLERVCVIASDLAA